ATERGSPTLHDGPGGLADVGRQRVGLLVGRKRVLEDGLERHESHRCLRTRDTGRSLGWFFTVSRQPSPLQAVSPTLRLRRGGQRERGTSVGYRRSPARRG